jgi:tetratricopeptide (TPR) repeat protein
MVERAMGCSHWLRSALLLTLLLTLACAAVPVYEKPWIEVRTEHFEIASAMGEEETLALANRLEIFRSVLQALTNAQRFDPSIPTRIYAFDRTSSYQRYAPRGSAGYFESSMRGYTIVVSPDRDIGTEAVIQHEYVHFLIRNQESLNYPLWYDEGFAELFGALRVEDDMIQVGLIPEYRLSAFKNGTWIPIRRVIEARDLEGFRDWEAHMLYAEAWALVHYLHYGREKDAKVTPQMNLYLSLLDSGSNAEEAWIEAFGIDLAELNKRLVRYLESGKIPAFGFSAEPFRPSSEPQVRRMSNDEIATDLGWLSISIGRYAQAQRSFEAAAAANPENSRAHVGIGDSHKFQDRWAEAAAHYQRGLALAPDDPLNHLDYAEYLHDLAMRSEEADERARLAREARRHYVRSQKLDSERPETYAMYGSTFLLEGEEPARGLETLQHAHAMLRSDLDIQLMLAEIYIQVERGAEARELLQKVVAWGHGQGQADRARVLLDELEDVQSGNPDPREDRDGP